MKWPAFSAISAKVVGTSPPELATPALLKRITSRVRANPSGHGRIPAIHVAEDVWKEDEGRAFFLSEAAICKPNSPRFDELCGGGLVCVVAHVVTLNGFSLSGPACPSGLGYATTRIVQVLVSDTLRTVPDA